jgi:predicted dehydrogenase/predicted transcriptional regulator
VEPVRVAVIGAGYWGKKLVYEYTAAQRNKGNVGLAGICDLSPTALAFCREKFSVNDELLTDRAEDLMEDPKISAVHIATPNQTHYALARMALEAGKDVLVEKPMTLGSREAYELVDFAASRELVLHVGHIFRFNSALNKAREMLNKGSIGKTFYARIQWTDSQYFPDRDIIFDLGPHPVDVLNHLLDLWPTRVSGFARAYRNAKDHDEIAYGLAEFDNDIFAHLELSWLHPRKVREASIVGSEGALIVNCLHQRLTLHTAGSTTEVPVVANNTLEAEISWFVDCVGRRCVDIESGLIGARTVEVLEAMRKSMWERPLPIVQPVQHDHTAAMVRILQSINDGLDRSAFATSLNVDSARSGKYLQMMSKLGLIRTTATSEGEQYEVTETGLHFLKEYGEIERDLTKASLNPHQKTPSRSA